MKWCLGLIALIGPVQSYASEVPPPQVMQAYHALKLYQEDNKVPGVMAVVYYDGKPYFFPMGVASLATKEPVTKQTLFALGSITKSFAAIVLAAETLQGRVKLDEPVSPYLPWPHLKSPFSLITFRHLATHTSGLPRVMKSMRVMKREEVVEGARKFQFSHTPGTHYLYSNLGFGLLGLALEGATHQDFVTLLKTNVLQPLHMDRTFIGFPQGEPAAQGYTEDGHQARSWPVSVLFASGSLRSCGEDMGKFLAACLGLEGTPEPILQAIRLTEQGSFPLGEGRVQALSWVKREIHGKAVYVKNGSIPGFSAFMGYIPELKAGVVILSNKKAGNTGVGLAILSLFSEPISNFKDEE